MVTAITEIQVYFANGRAVRSSSAVNGRREDKWTNDCKGFGSTKEDKSPILTTMIRLNAGKPPFGGKTSRYYVFVHMTYSGESGRRENGA